MRYETSCILFLYRERHFPKADSISWLKTIPRLSFASIVLSNYFPPVLSHILQNYRNLLTFDFAVLFYTSYPLSVKFVSSKKLCSVFLHLKIRYYTMMSGPKGQNSVRACTIRCLTLEPAEHEKGGD